MFKKSYFLFLTIILNVSINLNNSAQTKKMALNIHKIAQCDGKDDLPIYLHDWKMVQVSKYIVLINGLIEIKQDFPQGFQVKLDVKKCPNSVRIIGCDPFMTHIVSSNICQILSNMKIPEIFTNLVHYMKPPLICPLNKGTYSLTNLTKDDKIIEFLPQFGISHWFITIQGLYQDKEIACMLMRASIRPRRLRQ